MVSFSLDHAHITSSIASVPDASAGFIRATIITLENRRYVNR